jgi:hypothetical protein
MHAQPGASAHTAVSPEDPLRFRAFGINMQGGRTGTIDIAIERWSSDEERALLLDKVAGTTQKRSDQDKLVQSLQAIKPRAGYMNTPGSLGWDIKYARENRMADGTRQIVVVTDKPVSFFAARNSTRSMDYPFTLIEIRFAPGSHTGEGKLLAQTSISARDNQLQLELYGQEATRLTQVTQQKQKGQP